jgi:hypothetical protein
LLRLCDWREFLVVYAGHRDGERGRRGLGRQSPALFTAALILLALAVPGLAVFGIRRGD